MYYSRILAYYSRIILNSQMYLLCSKLCQHNVSMPTAVAHRELVPVEFAGREVKLPRVLHSFLTAIKGMPAERGVRPNPPEPSLHTGLVFSRLEHGLCNLSFQHGKKQRTWRSMYSATNVKIRYPLFNKPFGSR